MSRAIFKLGVGAALVVALASVLIVLAVNARHRGKLTHCRNNLQRLGMMAYQELQTSVDPPEERGRALWQRIREQKYYSVPQRKWVAYTRLNPFGCPVRGRAPLDLTALAPAEFSAFMSSAETIDYRGPKSLDGKVILGADREANHPRGGFVLWSDLSVSQKPENAVDVRACEDEEWRQALGATQD